MLCTVSNSWREMYPEAAVGLLVMSSVTNPEECKPLDRAKEALETALREQFGDYDRAALRALPTIQPYYNYYKRFRKTYHVQHQLESVALKGKQIPRAAALVEAMFMAELKNQLLTAGHDLQAVQEPLEVTVAEGDEHYTGLTGRELGTKRGDMMIVDKEGIISSIVYGPDRRTRIRAGTVEVLFTTYAPQGIAKKRMESHLYDMGHYVRLISPEAQVEMLEIHGG